MAPAHLRCGGDAEAAQKLRGYVSAAADGLRRIIIAGLYIDYLLSQLPHGHLGRWIETHCPDITVRSIQRWRVIAEKVLDHCDPDRTRIGVIRRDPAAILDVPMESVPEPLRDVRVAVDELVAGKSYRQLCFEFKQVEEDGRGGHQVKRGRRKGEGGYHPRHVPTPQEDAEMGKAIAIEQLSAIELAIDNVLASNFLTEISSIKIDAALQKALILTAHLRDVLPTCKRREALMIARARE